MSRAGTERIKQRIRDGLNPERFGAKPATLPGARTARKQVEAERDQVIDKVMPEVEAQAAEMEARQAVDTAERNAVVEAHRVRMTEQENRRRAREAAEEMAYQEALTGADESVLLMVGSRKTRPGGSPENKEGQMPKLDKKQTTKAAVAAKPKAEKKGAFCLMTGAQTTGARFSGLGTDAKYKSLLVNTALGDPKGEVVIFDHETGVKHTRPAIEILKSLNWISFLDKARASRKAKADATAKRAQEAKAAAKAEKPAKKAAGTTATS